MVNEDWKTGVHAIGLGLCNLVQWYAWELRARARQNSTEWNEKITVHFKTLWIMLSKGSYA